MKNPINSPILWLGPDTFQIVGLYGTIDPELLSIEEINILNSFYPMKTYRKTLYQLFKRKKYIEKKLKIINIPKSPYILGQSFIGSKMFLYIN